MRILTWNCNRGDITKKISAITGHRPDVAFIQEAKKPPYELYDSQLWSGDNENQGVAAFGFNGYEIEPCLIREDTSSTVLPFFITHPHKLFVLGVWAKQDPTYVRCIWKSLDLYSEFIRKHASIVLGDFNSNVKWNKDNRSCSHTMLVDRLDKEFDLVSSYHEYHNVAQGEEKHATIYWMHQEAKPYHIDYCFIPRTWSEKIRDVSIMDFESYRGLSDHRPLCADIALE